MNFKSMGKKLLPSIIILTILMTSIGISADCEGVLTEPYVSCANLDYDITKENAEKRYIQGYYNCSAQLYEIMGECRAHEGQNTDCADNYEEANRTWIDINAKKEAADALSNAAECVKIEDKERGGKDSLGAGKYYAEVGEYDEAREELSTAINSFDLIEEYDKKAKALIEFGDLEMKVGNYNTAHEKYLSARESLEKESGLDKKLCGIGLKIGESLVKTGESKEAVETFINSSKCYLEENEKNNCSKAALKARENTPSGSQELLARAHVANGKCYEDPNNESERQLCFSQYSEATEIYDSKNMNKKAGRNAKKSAKCLKNEDPRYEKYMLKCAGNYLEAGLSEEGAGEASDEFEESKNCYQKIDKEEHVEYIENYSNAWIKGEDTSRFNIEEMVEDPSVLPGTEPKQNITNGGAVEEQGNETEESDGEEEKGIGITPYLVLVGVILAVVVIFWYAFTKFKGGEEELEEKLKESKKEKEGKEEEW